MKVYRYSGDVKLLIPNGWKFCKLYARNYKAYMKDEMVMYVISKMVVEIDNPEIYGVLKYKGECDGVV